MVHEGSVKHKQQSIRLHTLMYIHKSLTWHLLSQMMPKAI